MSLVWVTSDFFIYFWYNENNEPMHFHIAKDTKGEYNTKFWLYSDGTIHLCHNNSRYRRKDLDKIKELEYNDEFISRLKAVWNYMFGYMTFVK